jgi:hypothetical protein
MLSAEGATRSKFFSALPSSAVDVRKGCSQVPEMPSHHSQLHFLFLSMLTFQREQGGEILQRLQVTSTVVNMVLRD